LKLGEKKKIYSEYFLTDNELQIIAEYIKKDLYQITYKFFPLRGDGGITYSGEYSKSKLRKIYWYFNQEEHILNNERRYPGYIRAYEKGAKDYYNELCAIDGLKDKLTLDGEELIVRFNECFKVRYYIPKEDDEAYGAFLNLRNWELTHYHPSKMNIVSDIKKWLSGDEVIIETMFSKIGVFSPLFIKRKTYEKVEVLFFMPWIRVYSGKEIIKRPFHKRR
jgi:hypothetical protein